ncbi:hypothetical protein ACIRF8_15150 [Streptomyces sp. NPDC102406]|uniref:hypothetical protein n=1 Tax=Streptomyces sp. NPDC102406 TaxID=3366171 RepID=UPI00380780BA
MNGNRVGAGRRERLYASTTATFDGDLDLIAIEYALNGEPVTLTPAEKIHAARILDARGYDLTAIGGRVSSDRATVAGWKDHGWKPGRPPTPRVYSLPTEPKCGEVRMYRRHLKNGEKPCDACRAANAAADRRYRLTGSRKPVSA